MSEFYPADLELPALSQEDGNADNEYTLNDNTAWITVGNISVYIRKGDEGVSVDLYPVGGEMEEPIASTWATYLEAQPNEEN